MRDPLEELRNLSVGATGPAVPASEVRRRGDRMRRRRTALQAAGVAAAVAVIASGGAVVSGNLTSSTPPAGPAAPTRTTAPSPGPEDTGEIPSGFPLDVGIEAAPGVDSTDLAVDEATDQAWWGLPCAVEPTGPGAGRRAAARRVWVQGDAWSSSRQLVVYRDASTAGRAFAGLRKSLGTCAETDRTVPGTEPLAWEVASRPAGGEEPWLVMSGTSSADGSHAQHVELLVTRVGSAVVVSRHNQDRPIEGAESLESSHGTVVEAMCRWSDAGCTGPAPASQQPEEIPAEPDGGWRREVPASVAGAMWTGLPRVGGDVPGADEDGALDLPWQGLPCGDGGEGEYVSSLRASWFDGVDARRSDQRFLAVSPPAASMSRQLVVYRDGRLAADAVSAIERQAAQCAPEPDPDIPQERRWTVAPLDVAAADEALVVTGGSFVQGTDDRTIGRTLVTVVRRGNAVLAASLSDESRAPLDAFDDPDSRALLEATSTVAEEMCAFTAEGCDR